MMGRPNISSGVLPRISAQRRLTWMISPASPMEMYPIGASSNRSRKRSSDAASFCWVSTNSVTSTIWVRMAPPGPAGEKVAWIHPTDPSLRMTQLTV